jgi:hypothetical protein
MLSSSQQKCSSVTVWLCEAGGQASAGNSTSSTAPAAAASHRDKQTISHSPGCLRDEWVQVPPEGHHSSCHLAGSQQDRGQGHACQQVKEQLRMGVIALLLAPCTECTVVGMLAEANLTANLIQNPQTLYRSN